jgi:hypothetical protein
MSVEDVSLDVLTSAVKRMKMFNKLISTSKPANHKSNHSCSDNICRPVII